MRAHLSASLVLALLLALCCQGCLYGLMAQGALVTAGVVGMAVDKATTEENDTTQVEASWDEWDAEQRKLDERMRKEPKAPVQVRGPDGSLEAEIYYPGSLEEHPAAARRNPEAGSLSDMVDPLYVPMSADPGDE